MQFTKSIARFNATLVRAAALCGLSVLATSTAHATAIVNFIAPEKYMDFPTAAWDRVEPQRQLTAHFEKLSEKLPKDETLKIEILDIDLAGRIEPNRAALRDIRFVRGAADWPRMRFRYTIERTGNAVASGEADISDMSYLQRFNRYSSSEPLRYEKRMIDEWFTKTFLDSPSSGTSTSK